MAVIIKRDILNLNADNVPNRIMSPKYITVHNTANTSKGANAYMHVRYQKNGSGGRKASWHYQVDDAETWQTLEDNTQGWHAGDGGGKGNTQSIGIEICENSDGDFDKAVANAQALIRVLMSRHNIPIENVVPHKRWSGKNCPRKLLNVWDEFIVGVRRVDKVDMPSAPKPSKPSKPTPKRLYRVRKTWANAKSQLGAYASLDNAKAMADANVGYTVYDEVSNAVYTSKPSVVVKPIPKPAPKVNLVVDGYLGALTIKALQRYFGTPVDGVISRPSLVIRKLQALLGVTQDGYLGTITIKAMQKRFGTYQDGVISRPSLVIRELQRRLNRGKL